MSVRMSSMAMRTALTRAAHQLLDSEPRIFEDPCVVSLVGSTAAATIVDERSIYQAPLRRSMRSHVVLRTRFTEDRLRDSLDRGVCHYVILGAGFDTFTLRQPDWSRSLQIVEIDRGQIQEEKRELAQTAGLPFCSNSVLVPMRLEDEFSSDTLNAHLRSLASPTFFSLLGVTMYLHDDAVDRVLRVIASFPPGSELVVTFASPPSTAAAALRRFDEPWLSAYHPNEFLNKLHRAGFARAALLSPVEAIERYFGRGGADLPLPHRANIAYAIC